MVITTEFSWRSITNGGVAGLALSIPLAALCFIASGFGHGKYAPMIACFPYAMLLAVFSPPFSIPFATVALVQFPTYGALMAGARQRLRSHQMFWTLATIHVTAALAAMCIASNRGDFWP